MDAHMTNRHSHTLVTLLTGTVVSLQLIGHVPNPLLLTHTTLYTRDEDDHSQFTVKDYVHFSIEEGENHDAAVETSRPHLDERRKTGARTALALFVEEPHFVSCEQHINLIISNQQHLKKQYVFQLI